MSAATAALSIKRAKQIVDLHQGVEAAMRRTVADAIKIGELLSEQKAELPHGEFLSWVERELPFSERTAQNYMRLHEYRAKTATVADLTTAYQVAQIEDRRRAIVDEARRAVDDEPWQEAVKPSRPAPAPEPEPRAIQDERSSFSRLAEEVGTDNVASVLISDIDTTLDALENDSFRHSVINALIKHLREKSVELNRKAVAS